MVQRAARAACNSPDHFVWAPQYLKAILRRSAGTYIEYLFRRIARERADIKDTNHWEVEARLKLSLFGSPKQGDIVGFNISTNDDDGGDGEESALFWTGTPPNIYSNEAAWGDLLFGELAATVSSAVRLTTAWGQVKKAD